MNLHADDFVNELRMLLKQAEDADFTAVEINAGRLYRRLRTYPEPHDRMALCCDILRQEMRGGDAIVHDSSADKRERLTIRFQLPRSP
ncbi:MAG: hypothetical protein AAGG11_13615 [Pseudomonadota bacterium]